MKKILLIPIFLIALTGLVNAYDLYENLYMNGYSIYEVDEIRGEEGLTLGETYFDGDVEIDGTCGFIGNTYYGADLIPVGSGVINLGNLQYDNWFHTVYVESVSIYDFGYNEFRTCYLYYGEWICR